MKQPVILGIYGESNAGKTTLIAELVSRLSKQGIRCGAVKRSDASMTFDKKGKDTWVYTHAGAELVVFSSREETVYLQSQYKGEFDIVTECMLLAPVDVFFIEGCQHPDIPKVRMGDRQQREYTIIEFKDNIDEVIAYIHDRLNQVSIMDEVRVKVNGKNIPLTEFPSLMISNTICGMVQSLKGVETIQSVEIFLQRKN